MREPGWKIQGRKAKLGKPGWKRKDGKPSWRSQRRTSQVGKAQGGKIMLGKPGCGGVVCDWNSRLDATRAFAHIYPSHKHRAKNRSLWAAGIASDWPRQAPKTAVLVT